jgi:site-specific DNA-methyltransferase (adenine-specific)/site-specific DNA-methyltransferase (cytosine-N4-specific)
VQYGLFEGDCFDLTAELDKDSVDLIVTSPPYADQRKATYGGPSPDDYVQWFLPLAAHMLRVLKPRGSFVLNIKEKVVNGERHTYVLELIVALKKQGWLWTEEYIWHKRNSFPGYWPNRLRDGWERCLHFTKQKRFAMYQHAVKVPIGDWAETRMKSLSSNDRKRMNTANKSGFGKNIANWQDKQMVLPTNVLHFATECGNKKHSAAFPEALPEFFIKLFTGEGDVVFDPFAGSGTTAVVAKRLKRNFIAIEQQAEYCEVARLRLDKEAANTVIRLPPPTPSDSLITYT